VNVNTSQVQAFRNVDGSNGACSLSNCSTAISMDGFILSGLDHVFGEDFAGEAQGLFWLGLQPTFKTRSSHQLAMSFTNNHEGCRKTFLRNPVCVTHLLISGDGILAPEPGLSQ
jgi:hypothetical protein